MCQKNIFLSNKIHLEKKTLYYWPCWRFVWPEGGKAAKTRAKLRREYVGFAARPSAQIGSFFLSFFLFHQTNRQLRFNSYAD